MADHRDDLDSWLTSPVQPLLPPPGTFDRIRRDARRRRTRRAALSAAGGLAIVAVAAVVIPRVAFSLLPALHQSTAAGASHPARASSPHATASASTPSPAGTPTGPPAPVTAAAPPRLSVTFVGLSTGWGMSQAGTAGQCDQAAARPCIALRRTDTGGSAWRSVTPPPSHGPSGSTGVSQVRFFNRSDGWAFGPQLWATHDSGRTWTQIPTTGWRVTALEARGNRVFSVWARCTGTGPDFAAHCGGYVVYSSRPGSNTWTLVPGTSPGFGLPGADSAASLLLTGTAGYLLTPKGILVSGPLTGAAWQPVTGTANPRAAPCLPGPARPGGQPTGALLAASASGLDLLCTGPSARSARHGAVYASQDGGQTWHRTGTAPAAGTATFLSAGPSGALVLATSHGIEISANGGASWTAASGTMPAQGFTYVGMTTDAQGVAVPADPAVPAVWFTQDGGNTWQRSPGSG